MKVLICGAGIAGLALAWCLERRRHEVLLVERNPALRDEGYMIDFFGSGYDAMERLGLLPDVASIHYPVERLAFVDSAGRERFSVPYSALRRGLFQDRHFNFMRGDLERILYERVAGREGIRFSTTVTSLEETAGRVHVRLSDGAVETADLLVGADGVHSRVRRLAFGDEAQFVRELGYHVVAFVIDEPTGALHAAKTFVTLTVPRRQVAIYPIRGGRTATFFLHHDPNPVNTGAEMAGHLRRVFGDLGWIVPTLIDRSPTASNVYFDSVQQIELPRWSRGRVVLLGDACQCVSLLAGQGASMAVAGAYVLAEELDVGPDVEAALARYERRLKPAIERQQRAGRRIAKWFVPEDRPHLALRNLALRTSIWPGVSAVLRRRMAAQTIFRN